ncbi:MULTISPECIES: replication initiation protein RepC [unclassified Paracoccus (in: a-proteobacteria)]|uniref:replication initiation protein RepC n=1 Tax=unclassified Paracoccus (in: a-proteobacteria) TaxID=2688777 RepID=UPI001EEF158A|nr:MULTISPECIES: replication initiation protein RepC [unclassified Paracoccus (in: a-proteobacteria)]QXO85664.1 putative replication protein [Paracoccus sp. (in: a-proteobacteria)]
MAFQKAAHPAATRAYRDSEDRHPALPGNMQRDNFAIMVERVAPRLGVGPAAAHAFVRLAAMTRPSDWTSQDRTPFIYAEAGEVAKMLGLSQPRTRAITAELERTGLIERRTGANGSRSRAAGTGLYFGAAIARADELMALDDQLTAERQRAIFLRGQRSTAKRYLKHTLERLSEISPYCSEAAAIRQEVAAWPSADRLHRMDLATLAAHVDEADQLCRAGLDLLEKREKTSGGPLENERPYIQDTTKESSVSCNEPVDMQSAGKPAQDKIHIVPPNGGPNCNEKNNGAGREAFKSEFIARLGPQRLFNLASPEMQLYLCGRAEPEYLRFYDFVWAAERRVPELGISPDAWNTAREVMGEDSAMLSILILDARKSEPGNIIFKPGGYLRAMTDRYRRGELHLIRSLIGLSERQRAGHGS